MNRSTDKEYELLRNEILEWQNRRFTLIGLSITVVTALLGLKQATGIQVNSSFITVLLLFFLSVSCWLTAYCGMSNVKIGTYLQVFHEGHSSSFNWESRNFQNSRKSKKYGNLNQYLSVVYLILAMLSLLIPLFMLKSIQVDFFQASLFVLMLLTFIASFIWLWKSQGNREEFLRFWSDIKEREMNN